MRESEHGQVTTAATGMWFANGMALIEDGRTLVVAETRAVPPRLTAFPIAPDGSLGASRTMAGGPGQLDTALTLEELRTFLTGRGAQRQDLQDHF